MNRVNLQTFNFPFRGEGGSDKVGQRFPFFFFDIELCTRSLRVSHIRAKNHLRLNPQRTILAFFFFFFWCAL